MDATTETARMLEELQANHWPALQTMLLDGWLLRFADGYSKRANSIQPLFPSSLDAEHKIAMCERIYTDRQLRPVFKIAPCVQPADLDDLLERKGYALVDIASVQCMPLADVKEPSIRTAAIDETVTGEWLDHYCRLSGSNDRQRATMRQMFANIRTKAAFVTLYHEGQAVACGIGVVERGYIGLWDIITGVQYRKRGFGEQLLLNLLAWGRQNGAQHGYLVVVADNAPALKLYAKLGFREAYRHWYRVHPGA